MQEWKLPSQLVTTDRKEGEPLEQMLHRHEVMRRLTAEDDLIKALDLLDSKPNADQIQSFLNRFLDKTINN